MGYYNICDNSNLVGFSEKNSEKKGQPGLLSKNLKREEVRRNAGI
jgi:hypothetical protein